MIVGPELWIVINVGLIAHFSAILWLAIQVEQLLLLIIVGYHIYCIAGYVSKLKCLHIEARRSLRTNVCDLHFCESMDKD